MATTQPKAVSSSAFHESYESVHEAVYLSPKENDSSLDPGNLSHRERSPNSISASESHSTDDEDPLQPELAEQPELVTEEEETVEERAVMKKSIGHRTRGIANHFFFERGDIRRRF